jgi:hypothetical protein
MTSCEQPGAASAAADDRHPPRVPHLARRLQQPGQTDSMTSFSGGTGIAFTLYPGLFDAVAIVVHSPWAWPAV